MKNGKVPLLYGAQSSGFSADDTPMSKFGPWIYVVLQRPTYTASASMLSQSL